MKRKETFVFLKTFLFLCFFTPFFNQVYAQTQVNDPNFATCLYNQNPALFPNWPIDTILDDNVAATELTVICIGSGITNLQGIQAFTNANLYANVINNALIFNDLSLISSTAIAIVYAPQADLPIPAAVSICSNTSWSYDLSTWDNTSGNQYKWYKNNIQVSTSANYSITTAGTYYGTITNSNWPLLTLSTTEIVISVIPAFDETEVSIDNEMINDLETCEEDVFEISIINNSAVELLNADFDITLPTNVEYGGVIDIESSIRGGLVPNADFTDSDPIPNISFITPLQANEILTIYYKVMTTCDNAASVGNNAYNLTYGVETCPPTIPITTNMYSLNKVGNSFETKSEEVFVYKAYVEENTRIYDGEEFIMSMDLVGNALGKNGRILELTIGYDCGLNWDTDASRLAIGASIPTIVNNDSNDNTSTLVVTYNLPLDGYTSPTDALRIHPRFVGDQCGGGNTTLCSTNFFGIVESQIGASAKILPAAGSPCNSTCTGLLASNSFERTIFQSPCFAGGGGTDGCTSGVQVTSYDLKRFSNFGNDVCSGTPLNATSPNVNLERVGENDRFRETYTGTVSICTSDNNDYTQMDVSVYLHNGQDVDFNAIVSAKINGISCNTSTPTNTLVGAFRQIDFQLNCTFNNGDNIEIIAEYTVNSNINNSIGANTIELTGMAEFYLSTANNLSTWRPSEELNNIDLVGKVESDGEEQIFTTSPCTKRYEYTKDFFIGRDYIYDTFENEYREWFDVIFTYDTMLETDFIYTPNSATLIIIQDNEPPITNNVTPMTFGNLIVFTEVFGEVNSCNFPTDDGFTLELSFETEYSPTNLTANAGIDQPDACSTSIILAGNTPPSGYTGEWTKIIGPSNNIFVDANNPTTNLRTNIAAGNYKLIWTVSEPLCGLEVFDEVDLTVHRPLPNTMSITGCDFVCSGDIDHTYDYSINIPAINVDSYTWTIVPIGSAIITAGQGTNTITVEFSNANPNNPDLNLDPLGTIGNISIEVTIDNNCGSQTYNTDVMYDTECVWPGDVNYNGEIVDAVGGFNDWVFDANALYTAENTYNSNAFLSLNPDYTNDDLDNCDNYPNHRNLSCVADSLTQWEAHPSLPWQFTFTIIEGEMTRAIDLKHADANGDGNITLASGIGICSDFDVIANHILNNPTATHNGNAHVTRQNTTIPLTVEHELGSNELIIRLADSANPVYNINHLAFTIDINAGNALMSNVTYSNSNWDFSVSGGGFNKYDFKKIINPNMTRHYIVAGQRNPAGVTFAGDEVCRIECIVNPVAWTVGNLRTIEEPTSVPITATIVDGGYIYNSNILNYTTNNSITFDLPVVPCDSTYTAFASSDTLVLEGTTVHFTNESTTAPNYIWLHNADTIATTTDFSFTFNKLGTDTITLIASNDSCSHVYQEIIEITDIMTCGQPMNPTVQDITCSSLTFTWNAMPNATAYKIAGRKAGGTWKVFPEQTSTSRTFTSGVQPNTDYEWSVKALCSDGWTEWIIPVMTFSTPTCKNGEINSYDIFADTQEIQNKMSLYPNPTRNFVQLTYTINSFEQLQASEILEVQIMDITGKVVLQQKLNANNTDNLFTLDISQLQKGQFFVRLQSEDMQLIDKLIIW
ncbi:MAG: T9SS type A sorting domain-containing protein [Chitinophagales bacterium]